MWDISFSLCLTFFQSQVRLWFCSGRQCAVFGRLGWLSSSQRSDNTWLRKVPQPGACFVGVIMIEELMGQKHRSPQWEKATVRWRLCRGPKAALSLSPYPSQSVPALIHWSDGWAQPWRGMRQQSSHGQAKWNGSQRCRDCLGIFFLFNQHYLQWHVFLVFCASFWKEISIVHISQTSS